MKLAKMLGLALVAALATMALAGAGTAAAKNVALCKENVSPCPATKHWEVGTVIKATGGGGKLKSTSFLGTTEVTCNKSSIAGKITSEPEEQQIHGEITSVEWKECFEVENQVATKACTGVTALQLPWEAHLEQGTTQDGNGIMWVGPNPTTGEQPGAKIECPRGTFTFKVKETQPPDQLVEYPKEKWCKLSVTGGSPPKVAANQCAMKGPLGVEGFWSEEFTITEPTPAWVTQQH